MRALREVETNAKIEIHTGVNYKERSMINRKVKAVIIGAAATM